MTKASGPGLQSSDDGITAWIGEAGAGIQARRKFARDKFDEIAAWLAEQSSGSSSGD
jgi:hypothetical protein